VLAVVGGFADCVLLAEWENSFMAATQAYQLEMEKHAVMVCTDKMQRSLHELHSYKYCGRIHPQQVLTLVSFRTESTDSTSSREYQQDSCSLWVSAGCICLAARVCFRKAVALVYHSTKTHMSSGGLGFILPGNQ
jgi:hypothetical protein